MVIEVPAPAATAEEKIARRRLMVERHGRLRTLNKLAYNWFRSRFLSAADAATVRAALFPNGAEVRYERGVDTLTVENINAPACIEFMRRHAPDVIAVCGTGVIKPAVFSLGRLRRRSTSTPASPRTIGAPIRSFGLSTAASPKRWASPFITWTPASTPAGSSARPPCRSKRAIHWLRSTRAAWRGARSCISKRCATWPTAPRRTIDRSAVAGRAFYSIELGILQYALFRVRFWWQKRRAGAAPRPAAQPAERKSMSASIKDNAAQGLAQPSPAARRPTHPGRFAWW